MPSDKDGRPDKHGSICHSSKVHKGAQVIVTGCQQRSLDILSFISPFGGLQCHFIPSLLSNPAILEARNTSINSANDHIQIMCFPTLNGDSHYSDDEAGTATLLEPLIDAHNRSREVILAKEDRYHSSSDFRSRLSPIAREACEIVSSVRQHERDTFWKQRQDSVVYPDMPIHQARTLMEQTELWRIIQHMPKGAFLHGHLEAMVSVNWLIVEALSTPGMGIRSSEPLCTTDALSRAIVTFQYVGDLAPQSPSLYSASYKPKTLVPIQQAVSSFPAGDYSDLPSYLLSRATLPYNTGPSALWSIFQSAFPLLTSILLYEPIFCKALARLFAALSTSGIIRAEFRLVVTHSYFPTRSTTPSSTYDPLLRAFASSLSSFQKSRNPSFSSSLILCVRRSIHPASIYEALSQTLALKTRFPSLVAGVDLVGHEPGSATLHSLLPVLTRFRLDCETQGVDLPFVFHAGETTAVGSPAALNMLDAVLLGSKRLGHATALAAHPGIASKVRSRGVIVEVCPVSNEMLGLVSVAAHPAQALLAAKVGLTLCNDDPALFWPGDKEEKGLGREFWAVLQSWEGCGLPGLGAMVENGINGSLVGEERREEMVREWRRGWEEFCTWVVEEYGGSFGSRA